MSWGLRSRLYTNSNSSHRSPSLADSTCTQTQVTDPSLRQTLHKLKIKSVILLSGRLYINSNSKLLIPVSGILYTNSNSSDWSQSLANSTQIQTQVTDPSLWQTLHKLNLKSLILFSGKLYTNSNLSHWFPTLALYTTSNSNHWSPSLADST